MRSFVSVLWAGLLAGCTPRLAADVNDDEGNASADDGEGDGDSSVTLGTGETASEDDGADIGEDAGGEDDADDCGSFLGCEADVPPPLEMCDFWAKSCPPGEKCTAIASTPGSGAWDANVCVPIGTAGIGEDCMMADGPQGTDTCGGESMCYDIDPETGVGKCVGFCQPPQAAPMCPPESGPLASCKITGSGIINLCLSPCNPLLPGECPTGQICVAAFEGQALGGFICFPPAAEGLGGEECSCANCCAEHHMCVAATDYGPDCAFDLCCTEYCDTEDPNFSCQGADQVCVGLFVPSIPQFGQVGQCVVP